MFNYYIDPNILEKYVPRGTKLDFWNGRCFVSVVGLMFYDTRVLGVPIPFHRDFEEVNLRFYVRREVGDEVRRGVVFIKEIVPRMGIAAVARGVYNENYYAMPMRHEIHPAQSGEPYRVSYKWRYAGKWNSLNVEATGQAHEITVGSEEEFIIENYWGFTPQRDGSSIEYVVEHPKWRVWYPEKHELVCDVEALYGVEFADALGKPPVSVFLADGSNVIVRRGVRIQDSTKQEV
jgi:hypothetical protein